MVLNDQFFARLIVAFLQLRLDIICSSAKKKEPGTIGSRLFSEFLDYFSLNFISNY